MKTGVYVGIGAVTFLVIMALASASSITIGQVGVYNSFNALVGVDLTITNSSFGSTNTLAPNSNVVITFMNLTNSVIGTLTFNTFPSNVPPNQCSSSRTYNVVNGEDQIHNGTCGYTINPPSAVSLSENVVPSTSIQNLSLSPEPNVSVKINVNPIPVITSKLITLNLSDNYLSNSTCQSRICILNITAQKINQLDMINPSFTNNTVLSFPLYNFTVVVNKTKPLGIKEFLYPNQSFVNTTLGIAIYGNFPVYNSLTLPIDGSWNIPFTNSTIFGPKGNTLANNQSVLEAIFSAEANQGCAMGDNIILTDRETGQPLTICTQLANTSTPSIFTVVSTYDLATGNLSQAIGQAVISAVLDANGTAKRVQGELNSCNANVNTLNTSLVSCNLKLSAQNSGLDGVAEGAIVSGLIMFIVVYLLPKLFRHFKAKEIGRGPRHT